MVVYDRAFYGDWEICADKAANSVVPEDKLNSFGITDFALANEVLGNPEQMCDIIRSGDAELAVQIVNLLSDRLGSASARTEAAERDEAKSKTLNRIMATVPLGAAARTAPPPRGSRRQGMTSVS